MPVRAMPVIDGFLARLGRCGMAPWVGLFFRVIPPPRSGVPVRKKRPVAIVGNIRAITGWQNRATTDAAQIEKLVDQSMLSGEQYWSGDRAHRLGARCGSR